MKCETLKPKKLLYRLYERLTLLKVIFWDHAIKKDFQRVWAHDVEAARARHAREFHGEEGKIRRQRDWREATHSTFPEA